MNKVAKNVENQAYTEILGIGLNDEKGGIESRKLLKECEILRASLNDQANQKDK